MNKVSERRKELKLTQKQLADKMNTNIRWIQKLESGEINIENITFKKAIELVRALYEDSPNDKYYDDWADIKTAYIIMRNLLK